MRGRKDRGRGRVGQRSGQQASPERQAFSNAETLTQAHNVAQNYSIPYQICWNITGIHLCVAYIALAVSDTVQPVAKLTYTRESIII